MRPTNLLDLLLGFIDRLFGGHPDKQRIVVFDADRNKRIELVPNPVNFSDLDEKFGAGNWALPAN